MMSCKRRGFLAVLILLTFLSSVLAAREPTKQDTPRPKIDYVAKLNELVKKGSDEGQNADPFYRKAVALYVESPTPVDGRDVARWSTELAEERRAALQKWVEANSEALAQLRLGAQKASYWFEYHGSRVSKTDRLRDLPRISLLLWALVLRAKFEAIHGDAQEAVDDLTAACHFAMDVRKGLLLVEQLAGLAGFVCPLRAGFQILDKNHLDSFGIEALHKRLMALSQERTWCLDLRAEEFLLLEMMQSMYAPWPGSGGKENTRVLDEALSSTLSGWMKADGMDLSAEQVYSSVYRYTPQAMATLIRKAFALYGPLVSKTPFQWRRERINWDETVRESVDGNPLLLRSVPAISKYSETSYRCRAMRDALITVLALLRYKNDKGGLPADLEDLVSAGYLREVPVDPYSEWPLIYRRTAGSFVLYSVGADFKDNGCVHSPARGAEMQGGDHVFWPVQSEAPKE